MQIVVCQAKLVAPVHVLRNVAGPTARHGRLVAPGDRRHGREQLHRLPDAQICGALHRCEGIGDTGIGTAGYFDCVRLFGVSDRFIEFRSSVLDMRRIGNAREVDIANQHPRQVGLQLTHDLPFRIGNERHIRVGEG